MQILATKHQIHVQPSPTSCCICDQSFFFTYSSVCCRNSI